MGFVRGSDYFVTVVRALGYFVRGVSVGVDVGVAVGLVMMLSGGWVRWVLTIALVGMILGV